jgi:hypothetical protein
MDFLKSEEDKLSLKWILLHNIESIPEKYFHKGALELSGELITKLPKNLERTWSSSTNIFPVLLPINNFKPQTVLKSVFITSSYLSLAPPIKNE